MWIIPYVAGHSVLIIARHGIRAAGFGCGIALGALLTNYLWPWVTSLPSPDDFGFFAAMSIVVSTIVIKQVSECIGARVYER